MPVLATQVSEKAAGDIVTDSPNITTMSPADGKDALPSIGVIDSTVGGASGAGVKVMVPGSTSVSGVPSWSVMAAVLKLSTQVSAAEKSVSGSIEKLLGPPLTLTLPGL